MINKLRVDILKASEEIAKKIRYEEKEHKYFRISDNKLLGGISSISELAKSKDSGDYLSQWKVNEALEYLRKLMVGEKMINCAYLIQEFKNAKYAFKNKSKEATDIGTKIHNILEDYIRCKLSNKEYVWVEYKITNVFKSDFLKWEKDNKVEWIATELLVGDPDNLEIAGRLDALAIVNGKLTIVDFKVANTISPNYYIQLSGYQVCLFAMGINIEDRLIMRLPKTFKRSVWINGDYRMVDNKLEIIRPPTNIEHDIKTFKNLRCAYKWLNQKILNNYEN